MKHKAGNSVVLEFLVKEGVLPSDNKEHIEIAKRKYWNNYKREWK